MKRKNCYLPNNNHKKGNPKLVLVVKGMLIQRRDQEPYEPKKHSDKLLYEEQKSFGSLTGTR